MGGSTTYVCNGADGTNGSAGTNGANGKEGPQGREGLQGQEGSRGPAGPPTDVTCKVRPQGRQTFRVTCTVAGVASGSGVHLHWRLTRYGRTASRGTSRGALRLDLRHLRPGHYQLYVQGQRHAITMTVG